MNLKRSLLILVIILVTVFFTGCRSEICIYTFDQDFENVKSVEIRRLDFDTKSTTPIVTLDENSSKLLLEDIAVSPCYKITAPSAVGQDCGSIVVYITYENGEVELIGSGNSVGIDKNGKWKMQRQFFDNSEFADILLKYVDKELVPELLEY